VSLNLEQKQAVVAEVSKVVADAQQRFWRYAVDRGTDDHPAQQGACGRCMCVWSRTRWCDVRGRIAVRMPADTSPVRWRSWRQGSGGAAKVVVEFAKDNEKFRIMAAA